MKRLFDVTLRKKSTRKAQVLEGFNSLTVDVMQMSEKNKYDHATEAMLTFTIKEDTNEGNVILYKEKSGKYKKMPLNDLISYIEEHGEEF